MARRCNLAEVEGDRGNGGVEDHGDGGVEFPYNAGVEFANDAVVELPDDAVVEFLHYAGSNFFTMQGRISS
jgi:hypothetical protein